MSEPLRFKLARYGRWQLCDKHGEWLGVIPYGTEKLALGFDHDTDCREFANRLGLTAEFLETDDDAAPPMIR